MVSYKTVNYCHLCKKRYTQEKGEQKKYYCDDCQKRIQKSKDKERKEAENA